MKQIISTGAAPQAIGPYSQAVWAGDLLFCSGQIPIDPATGQLVEGDDVPAELVVGERHADGGELPREALVRVVQVAGGVCMFACPEFDCSRLGPGWSCENKNRQNGGEIRVCSG